MKFCKQVSIERCLNRGAAGSGRSDDNRDSLAKRIKIYISETKPIIEHYDKQKLVKSIDASKSVDEVFGQVKQVFNDIEITELVQMILQIKVNIFSRSFSFVAITFRQN